MSNPKLIDGASEFHAWDATPAALEGILKRGPFGCSVETSCGGSTIILSHSSKRHIAFGIEGANQTITQLRKHGDMRTEHVTFVEGQPKDTLPGHVFPGELDLFCWTDRMHIRCHSSNLHICFHTFEWEVGW